MRLHKFIPLLFLMVLMACAATTGSTVSTPQNTAVTAYETLGTALQQCVTTYTSLKPTLTAAQQTKFNQLYGLAYSSYQTAGDFLAAYLNATTTTAASTALTQFQAAVAQLPAMTADVVNLLSQFQAPAAPAAPPAK